MQIHRQGREVIFFQKGKKEIEKGTHTHDTHHNSYALWYNRRALIKTQTQPMQTPKTTSLTIQISDYRVCICFHEESEGTQSARKTTLLVAING